MAYGLETGGYIVGGMLGGAGGALQGAAEQIPKGVVYGGGLGAATGAVLGVEGGPPGMVVGPGALAVPGAAIGGSIYGGVGAIQGAIAAAPGGAAKGEALVKSAEDWVYQMTHANDKAPTRKEAVTKTLDSACEECSCSKLANPPPIPGSPYRDGAHVFMQQPGLASHHMPPAAVSPLASDDLGPAIQMEKTDHYETPSYGRNKFAPSMQSQGALANTGQFMAAFAVDAAAVERTFPGKYTAAILQAGIYAECLRRSKLIN